MPYSWSESCEIQVATLTPQTDRPIRHTPYATPSCRLHNLTSSPENAQKFKKPHVAKTVSKNKSEVCLFPFPNFRPCYPSTVIRRDRQTDRRKRTGSPETNSHICGRSIFNEGTKQCGEKEESVREMVLAPLDIQPQATASGRTPTARHTARSINPDQMADPCES